MLLPTLALAQDRDGDTIPDAVEQDLGTDPDFAEELFVLGDDGTGEGAEKPEYSPCHDITRVYHVSVARGRYVWCVEFLEDFRPDESTFILYIDSDNDRTTGRENLGCEEMLHFSSGPGGATMYEANGNRYVGNPPRYVVDGNRLYCSRNIELNQENGKSVYRLNVLSEHSDPHVGIDTWGGETVTAPGESDRDRILTDDDLTESVGVSITRGPDLFEKLRADEANAHVPVSECELDGFKMIDDEYREWSARRTGLPAAIRVNAPEGKYYPGLFARDEADSEKWGFYLGEEKLGVAVVDEGDNLTKLAFLDEPVEFAAGDTLEIRPGREAGGYRIESVIFLAEKPEIRERKYEITRLEATQIRAPLVPDPTSARLTWITSWPTKCRVELGDEVIEEDAAVANHRTYLRGLTPGRRYTARITVETPDGETLQSDPVRFVAGGMPKRTADRPKRRRVPLRVLNATGETCPDWPIVCGIALPQGALMEDEPVRLVDDSGEQRDVQAEPASLWPDGSVKWLHVTFFATVPADEEPRLWLVMGPVLSDRPDDQPLLAKEVDGRIEVDTGVVKFQFPVDAGTALMSDLMNPQTGSSFGGRLTGVLTDADGLDHTATVDGARTALETNGPLRSVVRLGGKFRAEGAPDETLFDWEARITAYRGKPVARVLFTIANDQTGEEFTEIQSLRLQADMRDETRIRAYGMDGEAKTDAPVASGTLQIAQTHDDVCAMRFVGPLSYGTTVPLAGWPHRRAHDAQGKRADGWVTTSNDVGRLTFAVRNFWQQYPKSLKISGRGAEIGLLPALVDDQYAEESKDPIELVKLYYSMQDGKYKLKQGVAKTHEVVLAAGPFVEDANAGAFQDPLTAVADPEWTRSTDAWGDMPVGDAFWARVFDRAMDGGFAAYLDDRERTKAYGILNFGDWWGERKYNWGNIEYDTQHAFLQHFVRSGDVRYLYAGEQAARHNGDVDTVHFSSNPGHVGGVYAHCLGHVGGYVPSGFVDGGSARGGFSVSHTWSEGHLEAFFLTGDRRHLDNALLITDHYTGAYLNNYDFTNTRIPGWHLILTLATYRATGDPYYLNAAHILTERVVDRERPGGGWRRHMVPGHCHDEPRHHGNAGFMVGVLMRGLKDMHQATGDDRLPPIIVRSAKYLVDEMWGDEAEGFAYTSCPNMKPSSGMNLTSAEGFGYAVTLSGGDSDLARVFERGMVISLRRLGGMGKSLSHATRGTPHALRDLETLTPTGYRVGPSGEYSFILRRPADEAFSVQVRRLEGEGSADAVVRNEAGDEIARGRVEPPATDAWLEVPAGAEDMCRLELVCDRDSVWTVASTGLGDVLEIGEGVALAPGETEFCVAVNDGDDVTLRVRLNGRGSIETYDPVGRRWRRFAAAAEGDEPRVIDLALADGVGLVRAKVTCSGNVDIYESGSVGVISSAGRNYLPMPHR